jgi:DNA-binding protein YbaB
MQLQTQVQVIDSRMLDPEQRDALRQILLAAANEGEQTDE